MKKRIILSSIICCMAFTSCHNQPWEFPDSGLSTVYFSYQYPVRTIVLGEDIFDTSLDNAHMCKIMGIVGGGYDNRSNVVIDIAVDNSLCDNLYFKSSDEAIVPMPANYYTLESNKITIPKGKLSEGVIVKLADAFFADPLALKNTYVIPVVMTHATGVDSILQGKAKVADPNRCVSGDWDVLPKDFTLYAVKFINKWHANYLRRGKDVIVGKTDPSLNANDVRHAKYVEWDQVCNMTTNSLTATTLPLSFQHKDGRTINYDLILTFDGDNCTISGSTADYTVTGSGKFVTKGEKNSWGAKDRDVFYLDYSVDFATEAMTMTTKDTLVFRDRGVAMEEFVPVFK